LNNKNYKKEKMTQEQKEYLDALRLSGKVNMFEAVTYLV
jgi:hypothetical protein